jgi:hypothetical protein
LTLEVRLPHCGNNMTRVIDGSVLSPGPTAEEHAQGSMYTVCLVAEADAPLLLYTNRDCSDLR